MNRYALAITKLGELPEKFRSAVINASQKLYSKCPYNSKKERIIWDSCADVIAPVFFGFVYWILEQAEQKQIKRIYFLARDGQILQRIAEVISHEWNYNIENRYLYASRHAFNVPAIEENRYEDNYWIFEPTTFLSVTSICERVNLTPEAIRDVLSQNGFPEDMWNQHLAKSQVKELKEIFKIASVKHIVVEEATKIRIQALGYLAQEGLFDKIPFAIVDIGWHGSLQRSLSYLLSMASQYPQRGTCGFYFAIAKESNAFPEDQMNAFFYDFRNPSTRDYVCWERALIEFFTTADHGCVKEFQKQNDIYHPLLRSEKNSLALTWGLEVQHNAILHYTKTLCEEIRKTDCSTDYFLRISEKLLDKFIRHPDRSEAEAYGTVMIAEDQTDNVFYELAPVYTIKDCLKLLLGRGHKHHNVWVPGTLARSNPLIRLILEFVLAVKFIRKRILALKTNLFSS